MANRVYCYILQWNRGTKVKQFESKSSNKSDSTSAIDSPQRKHKRRKSSQIFVQTFSFNFEGLRRQCSQKRNTVTQTSNVSQIDVCI